MEAMKSCENAKEKGENREPSHARVAASSKSLVLAERTGKKEAKEGPGISI